MKSHEIYLHCVHILSAMQSSSAFVVEQINVKAKSKEVTDDGNHSEVSSRMQGCTSVDEPKHTQYSALTFNKIGIFGSGKGNNDNTSYLLRMLFRGFSPEMWS